MDKPSCEHRKVKPTKTIRFKLTLSHFSATVLSVLAIELIFILAYLVYLNTRSGAEWAGIWAARIADAMSVQYDGEASLKDVALSYTDHYDNVSFPEQSNRHEYPHEAEWLVIVDPKGRVVTGTVSNRYHPGTLVGRESLPGFKSELLPQKRDDDEFIFNSISYDYSRDKNSYIGQATIIGENDRLAGWVYYGATIRVHDLFTRESLAVYFGTLALSSAVGLGISWWLCGLIARSYSQRLTRLRDASVAVSSGDYSVCIPLKDGDEIDQVGEHFMAMAAQLDDRVRELRELAEWNALLAEEASALASLEERNRIARDLHDSVKQQLFGISLSAGAVEKLIEMEPDKAGKIIREIIGQTQDTQKELDEVIHHLRPPELGHKGLAAALKDLCFKWQAKTGIEVDVIISGTRELSLTTEYSFYRIAQESLNNIGRHSEASTVTIKFVCEMTYAELTITDNGKGFDIHSGRRTQSIGLSVMKERAEMAGGFFSISSVEGVGTRLTARLPVRGIK